MDESESEDSLCLTINSEIERVSLALERAGQFMRRQGLGNADGILLVVRELTMNAIVHGNGSVRSRIVLIRIARRGRVFEVQVDDEGEGFDCEALDLGLPENPQTLAKRGLVLVRELSEALAFERGGSRVRAIVDPEGRRPGQGRMNLNFIEQKDSREEPCTSPMGKSL